MKLAIVFNLNSDEKEIFTKVFERHGWSVDETGWISRSGQQVDFLRDQDSIPEFPSDFVGYVERRSYLERKPQ
jgi:hypothetical protein